MEINWDDLFFNLIKEYKKKSKDPSSKFAAIVVDSENTIKASGFNGFPRRVKDLPERYADRNIKLKFIVHAEINAISLAAKCGSALGGCKIYIDTYPCNHCCQSIIQAGIKEIILNGDSEIHNNKEFQFRWKDEIDITKIMCEEAGVLIRIYQGA